jgi:hypothetical protein
MRRPRFRAILKTRVTFASATVVLLAILFTDRVLAQSNHTISPALSVFEVLSRLDNGDISLTNQTPLAEWKSKLKRVDIGTNSLWVVQSDMAMNDEELAAYAIRYQASVLRDELFGTENIAHIELSLQDTTNTLPFGIIRSLDGRGSKWTPGTVLTYAIYCTNNADYLTLVQVCDTVSKDWQSICGVKFAHLQQYDNIVPNDILANQSNIVFVVQVSSQDPGIAALSFFPYQPRDRRILTFYPSFFKWQLLDMKVGICRHEFGHLLGFAHEHDSLSAGPDCPRDPNTIIVTIGNVYDADSVMHYHCGANQNYLMKFTDQDKKAAMLVYGKTFQNPVPRLPHIEEYR